VNFNLDNRILLAGSFVAAISMLPFNEGFYIFTRVVVCLTGVYAFFLLNKEEKQESINFKSFML
jgi:Ca2+/Na+ antiporter